MNQRLESQDHSTLRRVVTAGVVLGVGMGGFVDGILFHQILQTHGMLSAKIGRATLAAVEVNMFWDGLFHAVTWTVTAVGIALLWRAASHARVQPRSSVVLGGALLGWGAFNLVEGVIDHHVLGVHHVIENAANHLPYDLAFLASGVVFSCVGALMVRSAAPSNHTAPPLTPLEHRG
jgi:uncharacterized membrane protein